MPLGQPIKSKITYLKNLYYGPPGTAKTTHMASMANLGLCVAIDFEGEGWIAEALEDRNINTSNIIKFTPRSEEELDQVYWEVVGMIDAGEPVVGVALDHMTELQEILVTAAREKRVGKELKALTTHGKSTENVEVDWTSRDDYGVWTTQARRLTRKFRDLPVHVAYGAHLRVDEKDGGLVPALTEKFRLDILGSCTAIIGTVERENEHSPLSTGMEYLGITKALDRYKGKDRTGRLPAVMANPSMERCIQLLRGELDLETDPYQMAFKRRMSGG